mmetsp:Transcript_9593/g.21238  ORF Transcript_9593/g.21238 Transcript_9593/m.21238 type:complete len:225 (+) Transcript_9593:186-860(+)
MSSLSEAVQPLERHLVHTRRHDVQIAHVQQILRPGLGKNVLHRLQHLVFGEHRGYQVLHKGAGQLGHLHGNVDEGLALGGYVRYELRDLLEGVLGRPSELEGLALEVLVSVYDGHERFAHVVREDRLHQRAALVHQRKDERDLVERLGGPVGKAVLRAENSCGSDDNRVGQYLTHGCLSGCLSAAPVALGVRVCRHCAHVDECLHPGVSADLRDCAGDVHMYLL